MGYEVFYKHEDADNLTDFRTLKQCVFELIIQIASFYATNIDAVQKNCRTSFSLYSAHIGSHRRRISRIGRKDTRARFSLQLRWRQPLL